MKKTYVYLIKCEGFVKIGNAHDPEKRMKDMQVGNPFELELIAKLPFEGKRAAHTYEMELHHRLRKHRVRGEWFAHKAVSLALRAPHKAGDKKTKRTPKDERWHEEPYVDKQVDRELMASCPF